MRDSRIFRPGKRKVRLSKQDRCTSPKSMQLILERTSFHAQASVTYVRHCEIEMTEQDTTRHKSQSPQKREVTANKNINAKNTAQNDYSITYQIRITDRRHFIVYERLTFLKGSGRDGLTEYKGSCSGLAACFAACVVCRAGDCRFAPWAA